MNDSLLQLMDLSAGLDDRALLSGIDFALRPGELVGFQGESGCGKSTLLRTIAGLINPISGEVRGGARDPEAENWPAFRRRVVLVSQQPVLLDGSIGDNLERPFLYQSSRAEFSEAQATALLTRVGLEDYSLTRPARDLSVGEQQRLCLVRALLIEPDVLLLDEPTSALDEGTVLTVERLIREETQRRAFAAIVVSHDRAQLERWCDRVVDLDAYSTAAGAEHAR